MSVFDLTVAHKIKMVTDPHLILGATSVSAVSRFRRPDSLGHQVEILLSDLHCVWIYGHVRSPQETFWTPHHVLHLAHGGIAFSPRQSN